MADGMTGQGTPRLAPHARAVRVELPAVDASVPRARRFVDESLPSTCWADEVTLLVSELASNAVRHARTPFSVTVACDATTVRVEVADGDPHLPVASAPPADAISGRGLVIVDALASRWGVEPRGAGKVVWFELACPSPAS